MSAAKKIIIVFVCCALIVVSWLLVLSSGSDRAKQKELVEEADLYYEDKIYIKAQPLLEEAVQYNTPQTLEIKRKLADVYWNLGDLRSYITALQELMEASDAPADTFREAADYYFGVSKYQDALACLAAGIEKTGDEGLQAYYEQTRYQYRLSHTRFEEISAIHAGMAKVQRGGKWGIVSPAGSEIIPCEYDLISTFDQGCAVVRKEGEIYTVNSNNQRLALLKIEAEGFYNLSEQRIAIQVAEGWMLSTPELIETEKVFENMGMYSNGYAAVKIEGRWGLCNRSGAEFLLPAQYEAICLDELGRSYAQGAVFVQEGGFFYLVNEQGQLETAYEDARPFADGYAAVKKDGKWGFIDVGGTLVIACTFDDALSFGMHLAAVEQDGLWGYINREGEMVIEPVFLQAKSFSGGYAPVLTDTGWTFASLEEYRDTEGGGLV